METQRTYFLQALEKEKAVLVAPPSLLNNCLFNEKQHNKDMENLVKTTCATITLESLMVHSKPYFYKSDALPLRIQNKLKQIAKKEGFRFSYLFFVRCEDGVFDMLHHGESTGYKFFKATEIITK